jgi:hypothetical protein
VATMEGADGLRGGGAHRCHLEWHSDGWEFAARCLGGGEAVGEFHGGVGMA